eukprot:CFRG1032T1
MVAPQHDVAEVEAQKTDVLPGSTDSLINTGMKGEKPVRRIGRIGSCLKRKLVLIIVAAHVVIIIAIVLGLTFGTNTGAEKNNPSSLGSEGIDECTIGLYECSEFATCTDLSQGYSCTCNFGYTGDGKTCEVDAEDPDECLSNTHNCGDNSFCTNLFGGFRCTCEHGFEGDGLTCSDVDECATNMHTCDDVSSFCVNKEGGFSCTCRPGYEDYNSSCVDINECAVESPMHNCSTTLEVCINTPGNFICACIAGYERDGNACKDINECEAGTDNCDDNAACSNTEGGYECICNAPYWTGNGMYCDDVNECSDSDNQNSCNEKGDHVICKNKLGAPHACDCEAGYYDLDSGEDFDCRPYSAAPTCDNFFDVSACPTGKSQIKGANEVLCDPVNGCEDTCCTQDTCLYWIAASGGETNYCGEDGNPINGVESIQCPSDGCNNTVCCQSGADIIPSALLQCTRDEELLNFENMDLASADDDRPTSGYNFLNNITFWSVYPGTFTRWDPTDVSGKFAEPQLESVVNEEGTNAFPAGDSTLNCPDTPDKDPAGTTGEWLLRTANGDKNDRSSLLIVLPDENRTTELSAYIYDIRSARVNALDYSTPQWYISAYDIYFRPVAGMYSPKGSLEVDCSINILAYKPWEFVISSNTHPIKYVRLDFVGEFSLRDFGGVSVDNIRPYGCTSYGGL